MARITKDQSAWLLPLMVALASLVISAYVGYASNDKDLAQRVTSVEAKQGETQPRLIRIEDKVDDLVKVTSELVGTVKANAGTGTSRSR